MFGACRRRAGRLSHIPGLFDQLCFATEDAEDPIDEVTLPVEIGTAIKLLLDEIKAQVVHLQLRYLLKEVELANFANGLLMLLPKVRVEHTLVVALAEDNQRGNR